MKAINQSASKIFGQLVSSLENGYLKLDNTAGSFMPLSVEKIGEIRTGEIFSLAHYGEQNGDLMRDPEVCFLKSGDSYYPLDFRNDYLGKYNEYVDCSSGEPVLVDARMQADNTSFCNQWLQNIKAQQGL